MSVSPENRDSISFRELLAWVWNETAPVHTNRVNLFIHLFAVPLFVAGPRDTMRWLYAEQFCNFWRFLFSGECYARVRSRNNQPAV